MYYNISTRANIDNDRVRNAFSVCNNVNVLRPILKDLWQVESYTRSYFI